MESSNETPNAEQDTSTAPGSSQTGAAASSPPRPLKRKKRPKKDGKAKKARMTKTAHRGYTVHQGEDMLLIVSSSSSQYGDAAWVKPKKAKKRKVTKKSKNGKDRKTPDSKKKKTVSVPKDTVVEKKESESVPPPLEDFPNHWGESVPEELLVCIFQKVVAQDGAVPFLCRVARVCRLWRAAASSPTLWRSVTISHCWTKPRTNQTPHAQKRINDTMNWLAENRLSQLQDFSLCHWTNNVNHVVQAVSQFSPYLRSLKLSYCSGLTPKGFDSLSLHSHALQRLDLQDSDFQVEGFLQFLESTGSQIKQLLFSHGQKIDRILNALSNGCCPNLEWLELNRKLDNEMCELHISIQGLQMTCPKLKTLRMMNVIPLIKSGKKSDEKSCCGFQMLEELSLATTSFSFTSDRDLHHILFGSTRLQVLDLRGCSRISTAALAELPCSDLECFFWGQYFSGNIWSSTQPKSGLHLLTQKWGSTLQQLDIANQPFTEEDLERAMGYLCQNPETLRSLNLSGTRITAAPLISLLERASSLNYLNLSSCRYLPRGLKRIYRDQEEIHQLLDKLQ